jgi:hypothetical protein
VSRCEQIDSSLCLNQTPRGRKHANDDHAIARVICASSTACRSEARARQYMCTAPVPQRMRILPGGGGRTLFTRASAFSASQAAAAATRCASRRCSRNSSSAVGPKLRARAAAAHGRPLGARPLQHISTPAARPRPPGRSPALADAPGDAPQQAAGQTLAPFSLR